MANVMTGFAKAREQMVQRQLAGRGIRDPAVLDAFRNVPREAFVAPSLERVAYQDRPLPIGAGQTISQPYIVALMIEAAGVAAGSRVLEVGAGSGYAAALLARIADDVIAIERHAELAEQAASRLAALHMSNVAVVSGDGTLGWPAGAPFDAILVAASGPAPPPPLLEQLAQGGRLVMPVGGGLGGQRLVRVTRDEAGFTTQYLAAVRFVPLIGEHGFGG